MAPKAGQRGRHKSGCSDAPGYDLLDLRSSPDVRVIFGLLGASPKKGVWRLFLSVELEEYLEFADQDVVHSQRLTDEESQVGGTVVWLRRDSNAVHIRSSSRQAQVGFLYGEIAGRFLRHSAPLPSSPASAGVGALVAGGCHTGGDFDTLCAACTAVPTALMDPRLRIRGIVD